MQYHDLPRRKALKLLSASPLLASSLPLLLAACGGDDDEPSGTADAPDTEADTGTDAGAGAGTGTDADTDTPLTAPTLTGRIVIPADSFVPGPTSGQYISGGDYNNATGTYGYTLPFAHKQPVQGFSALADDGGSDILYAMPDNGFGGKAASPDALLYVFAFKPDWESGTMQSVHIETGERATDFDGTSFIRLSDPDHKLGFALVADGADYPGTSVSPAGQAIAVDPEIVANRLLTGGDIDPESLVVDADGNFWFGDEFGPFLIKTDRTGKVLQQEIPVPNLLKLGDNAYVQTSNNPYVTEANLPGSGGLESMAIDPSRTRIYTLFERELSTDDNKQRRLVYVFDIAANAFLDTVYQYRVGAGTYTNADGATVDENYTINDITAVNDHQFLVLEKDRGAGDARTGNFPEANAARVAARHKKVYLVDLNETDANGFLVKTEVVDLMNLADPDNIGGSDTIDGVFTFPMECVETVHILDATTLVVANDNNYPGGAPSRDPSKVDANEFIRIALPTPLNLG